jgi:hypothetical protein
MVSTSDSNWLCTIDEGSRTFFENAFNGLGKKKTYARDKTCGTNKMTLFLDQDIAAFITVVSYSPFSSARIIARLTFHVARVFCDCSQRV